MASDVQICNLALAKLGQSPIMALSQNTPRAEKLNAVYELLRDIELSEHNWDFATIYTTLVAVDETPAYEYTYVYQLPSDFLKLVRTDSDYNDYRIVGDKIYTDQDEIGIEYIGQGSLSQPFIDLLAARIAKDLAWSITNNKNIVSLMAEDYKVIRRKATGVDSQQGKPRKLFINKMDDARRLN